MIKSEYLIMLSEIIDKMGIANELKSLDIDTGNEEKDKKELGTQLIVLIFTNIYKCKKEFYTFIAYYKNYLKDEEDYENIETYENAKKEAIKKAKQEDIISILKNLMKLEGVKDFLSLA